MTELMIKALEIVLPHIITPAVPISFGINLLKTCKSLYKALRKNNFWCKFMPGVNAETTGFLDMGGRYNIEYQYLRHQIFYNNKYCRLQTLYNIIKYDKLDTIDAETKNIINAIGAKNIIKLEKWPALLQRFSIMFYGNFYITLKDYVHDITFDRSGKIKGCCIYPTFIDSDILENLNKLYNITDFADFLQLFKNTTYENKKYSLRQDYYSIDIHRIDIHRIDISLY